MRGFLYTVCLGFSAINATTVQVVLATAPAADPATTDFQVQENGNAVAVSAVAKVASDTTGKTYKLTVASLANKQGSLTVNGVAPAAKIAVGSEYDFDFKAPVIESVQVVGARQLQLNFSEKMDASAAPAATVFNTYEVTKISDGSVLIENGVGGAVDRAGVLATLSPDKKSVTLTLGANMVPAQYAFSVKTAANIYDIQGVAGNQKVYPGTEILFTPTAEQLVDTTAAVINLATYNTSTGKLTLTFNKAVTDAATDITKFSINSVNLVSTDTLGTGATANDNIIEITLVTSKAAVNALTGDLTLTAAAGAFGKTGAMTAGQTIALTKEDPPVLSSASYNQEAKQLTLVFDKEVTLENATVASLCTSASSGTVAVAKTETTQTGKNTEWVFTIGAAKDATLKALVPAPSSTTLKVTLAAGAVKNAAAVANLAGQSTYATGVAATYTADTGKPTLTAAEYNNNTKELKLTFSEKVKYTIGDITPASILIQKSANTTISADFDLTKNDAGAATPVNQSDIKETANATTLTFILKDNTASGGTGTTCTKDAGAIEASYLIRDNMKVVLGANAVKDESGLLNDATTYATGIALTFKDYIAPTVTTVQTINSNLVKVTFNETVDSATASDVANYVIKDSTLATLAVTAAAVQPMAADGTMDVWLTTAAQAAGAPYTIAISNVKDSPGMNVMAPATKNFNGSGVADVQKLTLDTLAVAAPANSKNDTLTLTFNAEPEPTAATNVANYYVLEAASNDTAGWNNATQVSLTNATAVMVQGNAKQVKITLDAYNLQNNKWYKVIASNLTTVTGKSLGTATGDNDAVIQLTGVAAPTYSAVKEYNKAENAIEITFDEELNAAAAVASNYAVAGKTVTGAAYTWNATTKKATVVLSLNAALTLPVVVTLADTAGVSNIKNLAGVPFGSLTINAPASLTDQVAPTVDTVIAKAVGAGDDTIVITFKDSDILDVTATNVANYVFKDGSGTVIPISGTNSVLKVTPPAFTDGGAGADKVTFTFDTTKYNLQTTQTYTVTISNIKDTSGNTITAVTVPASWDATGDTTKPTVSTVALETQTNTFTIDFSEAVQQASMETHTNYTLTYDVDGNFATTGDQTVLTPILATKVDADTVDLVVSNDTSKFAVGSKVRVATTNVLDLAGNASEIAGSADTAAMGAASAAPSAANLSFDAATGQFTVASAEATGIIRVYVNDIYRAKVAHASGTPTTSSGSITVAAGDAISYTCVATGAPESAKTADGVIPAAPTAAAIKAGLNNPANVINNASKAAAVVSVTPVDTQLATDQLFAVVGDGTTSVTNNGGTGVANPTDGSVTDVTLADAAGLSDGALIVAAYIKSSVSGNSSALFAGTAGSKDVVAPTANVTTTDANNLVVTYSEALYNSGTAIADGADVKALFTYDGTAGNYTSATYNATAKTVTFVITGEDNKALTTANTITDAAGNAVPGTDDVFTYTAGTTTWAKG